MTAPTRIWVTRAEPGAARTAARLTARGLEPVVVPLIEIRPLGAELPDFATFDGLIFTSLNGVAAFSDLAPPAEALDLPVFAVGDATARAARASGFASVRSADGDVEALARLIRTVAIQAGGAGPRLLHPGALQPAGDLAGALRGVAEIRSLPIYEAVATDLAPPVVFDVVLIHSPRAARELATRLSAADAANRVVVAISAAAALPLLDRGFAAVHIAETPDETGLFDALKAALGKPPAAV